MVDDFACGSADRASADKLIKYINDRVTTENLGIGEITARGAENRYNGVDICQTRDYIKLSCETYIDRLLQTHGWESPDSRTSDRHDQVPMSPERATHLQELSGPAEDTAEHAALAEQHGFSYRQLLGALMYAYVVCRLDIGYAVTLLSKYASAPHSEHYTAAKNVCRYL
jgi:hypothetical protein